jgi:hypothetical protein
VNTRRPKADVCVRSEPRAATCSPKRHPVCCGRLYAPVGPPRDGTVQPAAFVSAPRRAQPPPGRVSGNDLSICISSFPCIALRGESLELGKKVIPRAELSLEAQLGTRDYFFTELPKATMDRAVSFNCTDSQLVLLIFSFVRQCPF